MPMLFDGSSDTAGAPATHALVVGISNYTHLPCPEAAPGSTELTQVTFCARSASTFARWLVDNRDRLALPLATCQLLVAPSDEEAKADQFLREHTEDCTVAAFVEAASVLRRHALTHRDGAVILYFAGHAIQLGTEQPALLLQDYGDGVGPTLRAAVSVSNLLEGLAPADWQPNIARQQFMFFDTDRVLEHGISQESLWRATEVFDVPRRSHFDDRRTCVLYASAPGEKAFAFRRDRTFFSTALIKCLDGSAYESEPTLSPKPIWRVTTRSLVRAMQAELDAMGSRFNQEQRMVWNIRGDDAVLLERLEPPMTDLHVMVEPPERRPNVRLEVFDAQSNLIAEVPAQLDAVPGSPIEVKDIPAGMYLLKLSELGRENQGWQSFVQAMPSRMDVLARIQHE